MSFIDLALKNQAISTLASDVNDTDDPLTLSVVAGDGDLKFPATGGGKHFKVFLVNAAKQYEILECTSRTGDNLTCTRAREGTVARNFVIGDAVEVRFTAGDIDDLITYLGTLVSNPFSGTLTLTGNLNIAGATIDMFPAGMEITQFQTTIPTGWEINTAVDDAVPIIRSSASFGGGTGGSWTISGLTTTHTHSGSSLTASGPGIGSALLGTNTGGNDLVARSHYHNIGGNTGGVSSSSIASTGSWRPKYVYAWRGTRVVT